MKEIEDPELAQKTMKEIYKHKGYSDDWIEKRVRKIAIRDELRDNWNERGIKTNRECCNKTKRRLHKWMNKKSK